jgi:hypothetical protein
MQTPLIDWETLRIEENQDKEERTDIVDDDMMYELLGFRAEDEEADKARKAASKDSGQQNDDICQRNEEFDIAGQPLKLMTIYQGRGLWYMIQIDPVWILAQFILT